MNWRSVAPVTTEHTVCSIVLTDALRTPPSSASSPKYSPAPWVVITTSFPFGLVE